MTYYELAKEWAVSSLYDAPGNTGLDGQLLIISGIQVESTAILYYTLHEADITKFADIVDSRIKKYFYETNLKRIRTAYGFTQAGLAEHTGVSLGSIQMYEQRNKNINKASVDTVYSLSKALGCTIEDLIEK